MFMYTFAELDLSWFHTNVLREETERPVLFLQGVRKHYGLCKVGTAHGGWIWRVCNEAEAAEFSPFIQERQDDIPVWQESQQFLGLLLPRPGGSNSAPRSLLRVREFPFKRSVFVGY